MSTAEEQGFWSFALTFYQHPEHQQRLLALQDEGGLDVCFVLLALWHGHLHSGHWVDLFHQSKPLRDELAELRQLRRRNKQRWSDDSYYQQLKMAELSLEKILYLQLGAAALALSTRSNQALHRQQSLEDLLAHYHSPDSATGGAKFSENQTILTLLTPRE